MRAKDTFRVAESPVSQRGKRQSKVRSHVAPRADRKVIGKMSFEDFCGEFSMRSSDEPFVFDAITKYLSQNELKAKNWAEISDDVRLILKCFGGSFEMFRKLVSAICYSKTVEKPFSVKDKGLYTPTSTMLRKKEARRIAQKRRTYRVALKTVIDSLLERALPLSYYQGDEKDPLSGRRMREVVHQLRILERAETQADDSKMTHGRRARIAYDASKEAHLEIGKDVSDPITVFLIYAWKCKQYFTGSTLKRADYEAIAGLFEFWQFFGRRKLFNLENEITKFRERLKKYPSDDVHLDGSFLNRDSFPSAFIALKRSPRP